MLTFAYVLKDTVFHDFLTVNRGGADPVDVNNLALQTRYRAYCLMPHLAWVDSSYSDIRQTAMDHWYLRESLVLHGHSMTQLLSRTTLVISFHNPGKSLTAERDLLLIVKYYCEQLTGVTILIVEQAIVPTLDFALLPDQCRYSVLEREGPLHRGACLRKACSVPGVPWDIVMFSDSNILLETQDVRGNARMCERYGLTTGFRNIIEAARDESAPWPTRLLTGRTEQIEPHAEDSACSYCRFFKADTLRLIMGDENWWDRQDPLASLQARQPHRVFNSPNDALRLKRD